MANMADYKFFTAPDASHLSDPVMGPILQQLRNEGHSTFHVLHKWMTYTAPNAEAEIRVDYTDLFDGVATPILIAIDSSDNAQDKAAGTGALTAKMLLTNDAHLMCEETFTLNGSTVVDSTQDLYEHINEVKLLTYGTDGNPTGTIQAISHADNKVYAKIANTDHCTINARTYIPAGYTGYLVLNAKAKYIGIPSDAAGMTATEGACVRFKFVKLDANEPTDSGIFKQSVVPGQVVVDITPPKVIRAGGTDEYVTLLISDMDDGVAGLVSLEWQILMWV